MELGRNERIYTVEPLKSPVPAERPETPDRATPTKARTTPRPAKRTARK